MDVLAERTLGHKWICAGRKAAADFRWIATNLPACGDQLRVVPYVFLGAAATVPEISITGDVAKHALPGRTDQHGNVVIDRLRRERRILQRVVLPVVGRPVLGLKLIHELHRLTEAIDSATKARTAAEALAAFDGVIDLSDVSGSAWKAPSRAAATSYAQARLDNLDHDRRFHPDTHGVADALGEPKRTWIRTASWDVIRDDFEEAMRQAGVA